MVNRTQLRRKLKNWKIKTPIVISLKVSSLTKLKLIEFYQTFGISINSLCILTGQFDFMNVLISNILVFQTTVKTSVGNLLH